MTRLLLALCSCSSMARYLALLLDNQQLTTYPCETNYSEAMTREEVSGAGRSIRSTQSSPACFIQASISAKL